jgi:hypothetical protein
MGGDGGSIPSRIDMVKTKGYTQSAQGSMGYSANGMRRVVEESIDPREYHRTRMTTCALTGQPLEKPVVACRAGYLFSKEAVLSHLINKTIPTEFSHITSLKDIVELKNFPGSCPITARDLNDGVTKSEAMWPCGCVIAEKALSVITNKNLTTCLSCSSEVNLRTKLAAEGADLARQLELANELKHKKKRNSDTKTSSGSSSTLSSKRLKSTVTERESVLDKYKSSSTYREIFRPS